MKKFLFSNKIYLPIVFLLSVTMIYGAYYVEANFVQVEDEGRVLGLSEEYVNEYFLPVSPDIDEEYSREFFELENFPQKMNKGNIPEFNSSSVYIYSPTSDYVFAEKNSENVQAIASITKLMTALVFLENNSGWENIYEIKRGDRIEGGRVYVYLGDNVRVVDLFNLSLVASANTATKALVSSTGFSEEEFVQKMNEKAKDLVMNNSRFVDPIGISSLNVSTARDLSLLLKEVMEKKDIRETTEKKEYSFKTVEGVVKRAYSTDGLLGKYPKNGVSLLGGKTGYIDAAGFCFAGVFKNNKDKEVISIILGASDPHTRFSETDELVSWIYSSFIW
ncbi:MAG: serine hydrolase [Patescibacteria group bacterium]|jgi:D-alanyl-D-alanine carboxypeptidase|nr:serine hydrolase [Patescibacteria group bacterium]